MLAQKILVLGSIALAAAAPAVQPRQETNAQAERSLDSLATRSCPEGTMPFTDMGFHVCVAIPTATRRDTLETRKNCPEGTYQFTDMGATFCRVSGTIDRRAADKETRSCPEGTYEFTDMGATFCNYYFSNVERRDPMSCPKGTYAFPDMGFTFCRPY